MDVFLAGITLLLFVSLFGVLVLWGHVTSGTARLLAASLSVALSLCLLLLWAWAWAGPELEDAVLGLCVLSAVGVSGLSLRAQAVERRGAQAADKPPR